VPSSFTDADYVAGLQGRLERRRHAGDTARDDVAGAVAAVNTARHG
jgi:hypothetical protein